MCRSIRLRKGSDLVEIGVYWPLIKKVVMVKGDSIEFSVALRLIFDTTKLIGLFISCATPAVN